MCFAALLGHIFVNLSKFKNCTNRKSRRESVPFKNKTCFVCWYFFTATVWTLNVSIPYIFWFLWLHNSKKINVIKFYFFLIIYFLNVIFKIEIVTKLGTTFLLMRIWWNNYHWTALMFLFWKLTEVFVLNYSPYLERVPGCSTCHIQPKMAEQLTLSKTLTHVTNYKSLHFRVCL